MCGKGRFPGSLHTVRPGLPGHGTTRDTTDTRVQPNIKTIRYRYGHAFKAFCKALMHAMTGHINVKAM